MIYTTIFSLITMCDVYCTYMLTHNLKQKTCKLLQPPIILKQRDQGQRKSAAWPSSYIGDYPTHLASNTFSSASFTVTTISSFESPLRSISAILRASPGTTRPDSLGQTG